MSTLVIDILKSFGQGFGFSDVSPNGETEIHFRCENDDVIGFEVIGEGLLCFIKRQYTAFALDQTWLTLFSLINAEEWKPRQWNIGLKEENQLVLFVFLSSDGLGTEILNQLFEELWQLRDALPKR